MDQAAGDRRRHEVTRPVIVFQHARHETPGYFAEFLAERGVPLRVIHGYTGEAIPADPSVARGLVFMGGPMSVNDPLPYLQQELALIRRAFEAGVPLLGHCLGGQLIAAALGGAVTRNPVTEIGWFPVRRVDSTPAAQRWAQGTPHEFEAFHWHGETFSLPAGAELIWSSDACAHQAFAVGERVLAMQCHVEMTTELVRLWARVGADELRSPGGAVQSAEAMVVRLDARVQGMKQVACTLYNRWLEATPPDLR